MLKAKNILLILVLNYLLILLSCTFIEMIFLSDTAEQVQLMMRTAADMALEQVQATDDFFVSGGGYLLDSVKGYTLTTLTTSGKFESADIFSAVTGETTVDGIYNKIYNPSKLDAYARKNPAILNVRTNVGVFNSSSMANTIQWFKVPSLAMLGGFEPKHTIYTANDAGGSLATAEQISTIWKNYTLGRAKRSAVTSTGKAVNYYMTPLNVGITYIDEDLLQLFFMNNLDLLMRDKYTQRADYNLNTPECGAGLLTTNLLASLVDTSTLSSVNPINNGSFSLLRGDPFGGTMSGVQLYKGIKPHVEYKVIDMYDDAYNDILKMVFGAKMNTASGSIPVTGSNFKALDSQLIDYSTGVQFKSKPIVVAKVTFFADFVIPYSTVSLREMRGNVSESNKLSDRTLFSAGNGMAKKNNYVDLIHETNLTGGTDPYFGRSGLQKNSDPLIYTTYFAVTP